MEALNLFFFDNGSKRAISMKDIRAFWQSLRYGDRNIRIQTCPHIFSIRRISHGSMRSMKRHRHIWFCGSRTWILRMSGRRNGRIGLRMESGGSISLRMRYGKEQETNKSLKGLACLWLEYYYTRRALKSGLGIILVFINE